MQFLWCLLVPQVVLAVAIDQRDASPRALYFLDASPLGSNVVAMSINPDNGTLSNMIVTPTGQRGALGLNAAGVPGRSDPLSSQNAIIVVNDVNPP